MILKLKKLNLKIILFVAVCIFVYLLSVNAPDKSFVIKRVAHAGGGIENKTYTNSIDALNYNFSRGFSYFELDFDFTSDGSLVCMHGWNKKNNYKIFGVDYGRVPTLAEFLELKKGSKYNVCTLESLISWMNENQNVYIITDVKSDNIKALEIMSKSVPDYKKRVIPQIYFPEEFYRVKKMGYEQIIFTLYRTNIKNEEVLKSIKQFKKPFAVTMTKEKAKSGLSYALDKIGTPTYVHTINSIENKNELMDRYKVSEIYTDFLSPTD